MPQASNIYAVARIRSLEKRLLGRDRMARIAESSLEDAMRMLHESGYGDKPDATAADCEILIAQELEKTAKLINEVTPAQDATDLFLLKADVHNLKALIKARLLNNEEEPFLLRGGVYAIDKLTVSVQEHDYRDLPPVFADALNALERELLTRVNPQYVSVTLDRAYHLHARSVIEKRKDSNPFLKQYFFALADFDNVLALLRLRDMGVQKEALHDVLLPAGDVAHSALLAAFEQPFESLTRQVATGTAGAAMAAGMEEVQRSGRVSALEKARDDYLLRLIKKDKYDVMTIQPVLGFYLAREQEAKCIRLIITAKRNKLDESVIAERLRELYG